MINQPLVRVSDERVELANTKTALALEKVVDEEDWTFPLTQVHPQRPSPTNPKSNTAMARTTSELITPIKITN